MQTTYPTNDSLLEQRLNFYSSALRLKCEMSPTRLICLSTEAQQATLFWKVADILGGGTY